jgi:hypothetical protein
MEANSRSVRAAAVRSRLVRATADDANVELWPPREPAVVTDRATRVAVYARRVADNCGPFHPRDVLVPYDRRPNGPDCGWEAKRGWRFDARVHGVCFDR